MADPERARATAQAALAAARIARERGDVDSRLAALAEARDAAAQADDPALHAAACWRLAKARHDAGHAHGLLDAVRPILATHHVRGMFGVKQAVGPFDTYDAAIDAVAPLVRRHADHLGYADPDLLTLWDAVVAWADARHEGFLAAWARVEAAWLHAAAGRLDAVRDTAARITRLRPEDGAGTRRHPRAHDPRASIPWLQVDMARTLLRAETWHGEARAAAHAVDDLLDAAAAVDLAPHHDPWVLDALVQAGRRHGIADAATDALRRAHAALADHPGLPDAHRARVRATHAPSAAAWTDAADALAAAHAGPEWVVDALRDAAALDPSHADRLRDTAARYGVGLR